MKIATRAIESDVLSPAIHDWNDPDWSVLDDRRGDLPEFPTDVLTLPWQNWLWRASRGAGVRPEHVAVPLIGIASSLIGTARRVRASQSWSEPMTLWTCVVAASGDRKTPGLNVTLRALDHIERYTSDAINMARLAHETRRQKAKQAAREWKVRLKAALDAEPLLEPPAMPIEAIDPGNFIYPRLYATDPTIESLAPLFVARPRGMMLIRDELSGFFANMCRYGGSDRSFWLETWNGNRYVVERVSKRSFDIPHLLIGVIGGFQPDKLTRAFQGDEDGMSGRFLFAWPKTPGYRPLTNEVGEVEPELYVALTALLRLPSEDTTGAFTSRCIPLSDGALAKFEEFRQFVDEMKRGLDGRERQWLVKGETHVLRLAGTLAYMAWAISLPTPSSSGVEGIAGALEPDAIDEQSKVGAIRLWREYFWPHARAALRQIGLSQRHANARRVFRWIKANAKTELSREEIRREALGQILDAEQTQHLLDSLVRSGWLRETTTSTGGRARRRWAVNPKLWGGSARSAGSAESTMTTEYGLVPELPALSAHQRIVGQEEAQHPER